MIESAKLKTQSAKVSAKLKAQSAKLIHLNPKFQIPNSN